MGKFEDVKERLDPLTYDYVESDQFFVDRDWILDIIERAKKILPEINDALKRADINQALVTEFEKLISDITTK